MDDINHKHKCIKIKDDIYNNSKNSSKNTNASSFDSDSGKKINVMADGI